MDPHHSRILDQSAARSISRPSPRIETYRVESELEDLLSRSFPSEGDADRIRKIFADSLSDDALDLATRCENGVIFYSFPVAILASQR